jgi:hypothetical protein
MPDFAFPKTGGHPTTSTSEAKFRSAFIRVLAVQVGRLFYPYDLVEDFGEDANMNGL